MGPNRLHAPKATHAPVNLVNSLNGFETFQEYYSVKRMKTSLWCESFIYYLLYRGFKMYFTAKFGEISLSIPLLFGRSI